MPTKAKTRSITSKILTPTKMGNAIPIFKNDGHADWIVNTGTYSQIVSSEAEEKQLRTLVKTCTLPFQVLCIRSNLFNLPGSNTAIGALATIEGISVFDQGPWKYGIYLEKRIKALNIKANTNDLYYAEFEEFNDIAIETESKVLHLIEKINHYLDVYLPIRLPTEEFLRYATRCSLTFLSSLRVKNLLAINSIEELSYSQNLLSRLKTTLKHCQK
jgi:hypothetical protein